MIYSNACAYAIRAITRLALLRPEGYVLLDDLCEGTDLPRHFVAKIFQDLARKGLLTSAKGRGGGFALTRKPDKITLYEIVAAIDGVEQLDHCVVGMAECNQHQPCPQHEQWKGVREHISKFLKETTLLTMRNTLDRKLGLIGQPLPALNRQSKPLPKP